MTAIKENKQAPMSALGHGYIPDSQVLTSGLIIRPVHKGTNHVPKAVSDRDPLPDWVRDLNYVRSHALQTASQSQAGSAHCEGNVLFLLHSPR